MAQFVDVLLPLPLPTTYTYSVPTEHREQVATGCRVVVPLGKSKRYTALLMRAHDEKVFGDYPKLYTRAANLAWMERVEKLS